MLAPPLFVTALRMARKARSLNSVEKAPIDLGAGYLVSYERVQSFDSATDSDDPARAVAPIRLTVPGASTVELTDVARLVNPEPPSNGPNGRYGQYMRLVNTTSLTTPQGTQKASSSGFILGSFPPNFLTVAEPLFESSPEGLCPKKYPKHLLPCDCAS
jgi:hypothetical protein